MSCDRYKDAIVDHAFGAEIAADAAAHLSQCEVCRRMFGEQQRLLQNMDQELQVALMVEPSPRFVREAMTRAERSTPGWRMPFWWSVSAAAAAILIVVAVGSLRLGVRPVDRSPTGVPSAASTTIAERTPSPSMPSRAEDGPRIEGERPPRTAEKRGVSTGRTHVEHAAVMVPPGQSRALARYLELVRRGALDTSALAREKEVAVPVPTDLVIAPLAVDALAVSEGEGDSGPGVERRGTR